MNILAIGLGRTGGRLAGELARHGHAALAIHTSGRAFSEQQYLAAERCLFLGADQTPGTGGDVEAGRALIRGQADRIQNLMHTQAHQADFVLLLAGLGGGTGSAIRELIEVLDRSQTKMVALAVMPTEDDTVERRTQALRAVQELTDAQLDGVILVDGDKLASKSEDLSILDCGARTDERIVTPLVALDQLVSRDDLSAVKPLSSRQLLNVLTHGGMIAMGACSLSELTVGGALDAITHVLAEGELGIDGLDPASASAMQIVIEAPKSVLNSTPVQLIKTLREELKAQSPGIHLDVSVYQQLRDGGPIAVHVVASCADLPARLGDMVEDVAHEAAAVKDKMRRPPRLDLSILDVNTKSQSKEDSGTRKSPMTSDVAPRPDPVSEDGGPNAAVYARLVMRHKSSSNDELQRAIARRLEQDRANHDPRVRMLAVGAMAQIGAHIFDGSLVAATEDESAQVRELAERALASGHPTRRAL